jgi:uncharacterized membrane protein YfcA
MIPLMTSVLKMKQHAAHGTSLVIIVGAATAAALTYWAQGSIDWPLVAFLLAGSTVGAVFGARAAARLPAMRLRQVLGVFLVCVSARLFLFPHVEPLFDVSGVSEGALGAAIGLAGGLASGALGVGGGAIFVPALVWLIGTGQHEAQGVSLCVIVVTAATGALTHARMGNVDPEAAVWITPVAVPAGVATALLATSLSDITLRTITAAVLFAVGVQMVTTATRRLRAEPAVSPQPAEVIV